jgi:hypothetical protein
MDNQHRASTEASNNEFYDDMEKTIRSIGLTGFSFADCPGASGKRKKRGIFEEPLSRNVIAALRVYNPRK